MKSFQSNCRLVELDRISKQPSIIDYVILYRRFVLENLWMMVTYDFDFPAAGPRHLASQVGVGCAVQRTWCGAKGGGDRVVLPAGWWFFSTPGGSSAPLGGFFSTPGGPPREEDSDAAARATGAVSRWQSSSLLKENNIDAELENKDAKTKWPGKPATASPPSLPIWYHMFRQTLICSQMASYDWFFNQNMWVR